MSQLAYCRRPSDARVADSQRPRRLNRVELAQFHSEDYVEFLEKICPERLEVRVSCDACLIYPCRWCHIHDREPLACWGAPRERLQPECLPPANGVPAARVP